MRAFAYEPEADGLGSGLRTRLDGELAQDRRDMVLDRAPGEDESFGDLGVREVLAEQDEHLELSRGEVGGIAAGGGSWAAADAANSQLSESTGDDRGRGLRTHAL